MVISLAVKGQTSQLTIPRVKVGPSACEAWSVLVWFDQDRLDL